MMKMIYCDIDGTLTIDGKIPNSAPIIKRIEKIRDLSERFTVILWSGNGLEYAEKFKKEHKLDKCLALGKPHLIIDDNPTIRPNWDKLIKNPEYLDN